MRDIAHIQSGQRILLNGASGSLGTSAVQLAKYYGAEVTGVCSAKNRDLVLSLGADEVIDYQSTDFTAMQRTYDLVYDTIGKSSFTQCRSILAQDGGYLSPVLNFSRLLQMLWTSMRSGQKAKFAATGVRPAVELRQLLQDLKQIIEAGFLKSIMDKRYAIEQAKVAHRYVETGRKRGNVVLVMAS